MKKRKYIRPEARAVKLPQPLMQIRIGSCHDTESRQIREDFDYDYEDFDEYWQEFMEEQL